MGFVVAGLMNKQIAAEVNLSEISVKVHRAHLMKKMAARSIVDLVRKSESLGVQPACRVQPARHFPGPLLSGWPMGMP
jgi:DNA-binding NarL/FixJ family response regulator